VVSSAVIAPTRSTLWIGVCDGPFGGKCRRNHIDVQTERLLFSSPSRAVFKALTKATMAMSRQLPQSVIERYRGGKEIAICWESLRWPDEVGE
jgi:hypothetical protein